MKFSRYAAVTVFTLGAALASVSERPAFAKGPAAGAGNIEKSLQLSPKGMRWGLSLEDIAKIYDKQIEEEMLPLFRKAQPGLELDALNAEQKNRKGALRRSRLEFGNTPTGVDQSPLKGEYSYGNGESMATITSAKTGTKRYFFFFNDRLWKVYDEHKLKKDGPLGENFQEALKSLTKRFGAAPKLLAADYDKGRPFDEAEWHDPDKIIRAVDRGNILGVVYSDRKVQEDLAHYRKNKVFENNDTIDRDVAAVTKKAEEPKPADKDKSKGAKKR